MVRPHSSEVLPRPESDAGKELFARRMKMNAILSAGALSLAGIGLPHCTEYSEGIDNGFSRLAPTMPLSAWADTYLSPKPIRLNSIDHEVSRPTAKTIPPAWAIAGPSTQFTTISNQLFCDWGSLENLETYEKPTTTGVETLGSHYRVLFPKENPVQNERYDVWFHFHGNEPFWKAWTQAMRKTVLITMKKGEPSSSYAKEIDSTSRWNKVRETISKIVADHYGTAPVSPRRIGLSGWSAGCAATQKISDFAPEVDAIICLDGIHGTYQDAQNQDLTEDQFFKSAVDLPTAFPVFARDAADGDKFLGITHSSIPYARISGKGGKPFTYFSSTTAMASKMIWWVGGSEPTQALVLGGAPYEIYRRYDQGNFHVIGTRGADGGAHWCQFQHLDELLKKAKESRGFQ